MNIIGEPCDRKGHARFDGEARWLWDGLYGSAVYALAGKRPELRSPAYGSATWTSALPYTRARQECTCSEAGIGQITSAGMHACEGPLLDRIDIFVDVPRVDYEKLQSTTPGERTADVRQRVEQARLVQRRRFEGTPILANAEMTASDVRRYCQDRRSMMS